MKRFIMLFCTVLSIILLIFGSILIYNSQFNPDFIQPSDGKLMYGTYGDYIGGFIGTIIALGSVLLIISTLLQQNIESYKSRIESSFFKMLDYHHDNVNQLEVKYLKKKTKIYKDGTRKTTLYEQVAKGKRVFVVLKEQLNTCLKVVEKVNSNLNLRLDEKAIIDISYIVFYYGIDERWKYFLIDKISEYPKADKIAEQVLQYNNAIKRIDGVHIGRTNQTSLSSYFRNMYNSIRLIHEARYFSKNEKKTYIKILRAQLSNPELFILFFNVVSRFGKKWNQNSYVEKYELITNLPLKYCDPYDQRKYYKIIYEEQEI